MPIKKGYMVCRCCEQVATVYEAEGKRLGELYVVCPECGTDQSNKPTRQAFIKRHMATTREELEQQPPTVLEAVSDGGQDTVSDGEESGSGWLKVLGVVGVVGLCLLGIKK
ncbi:hypothetical protein ACPV34_21100 [Photobacterium damselae]|uniref:hypothetical protein n=1 Tax=Photobacterium damselae TaxID=38293 RepID=UPI004068A4F7